MTDVEQRAVVMFVLWLAALAIAGVVIAKH